MKDAEETEEHDLGFSSVCGFWFYGETSVGLYSAFQFSLVSFRRRAYYCEGQNWSSCLKFRMSGTYATMMRDCDSQETDL